MDIEGSVGMCMLEALAARRRAFEAAILAGSKEDEERGASLLVLLSRGRGAAGGWVVKCRRPAS